MIHIVPILCLILFIGLVEYRLKKHLDKTEERINQLEEVTTFIGLLSLPAELKSLIKEDKKNEDSSNE